MTERERVSVRRLTRQSERVPAGSWLSGCRTANMARLRTPSRGLSAQA